MKPASASLIALLNSGEQFIMTDLYTFTLVGGTTILRYSAAPTSIVANGFLFAAGPKFERSKTKVVIGTQVDELDIKIYPETTDFIGTTPFLEAAWQGQFDGALLQLERAFMGAAGGGYGDTSAGTVILFWAHLRHRLQPHRHRDEMPLAPRTAQYSDAAAAVAI